jgi:hypothetical protein
MMRVGLVNTFVSGSRGYLYLGNGDGTFGNAVITQIQGNPTREVVADFNHDGNLDLATANSNGRTVAVLLGHGDGTFDPAVYYSAGNVPEAIAIADFNLDGNVDIAVGNEGSNSVGVYLGNGDGTFQPAVTITVSNPTNIAAGDLNHDGKPDMVTAGNGTQLLLGNGDGTFQAPQNILSASGEVRLTDLNHDGKIDVLTLDYGRSGLLYGALGNENGTFRPPVTFFPGGPVPVYLILADLNNDGAADAITTVGSTNISALLGRR